MNNSKELIDLFVSLAKISGLSGEEKDVAKFITNYLKEVKSQTFNGEFQIQENKIGNLICKVNGGGDFVLVSHMDTARSTKNLKPIVLADRICSDGTTILGADNRAGIAAILYALKKSIETNSKLKSFTIAFTVCEETTLSGSKNLELDSNIKYGFVFDSHLDPGNFILSSPGALSFSINIIGIAAHAGIEPEKGINAIEVSARAISKIQQGRIDEETTLNIGTIVGGDATNVVPANVELKGEIRSFDLQKIEKLFKEVTTIFKIECQKSGCQLFIDNSWDFKPYKINENDEVSRRIKLAIIRAGLKPNEAISFGGSDANSLNEKGITTTNIGIGAKNPHSNEEYILINHLIQASQIAFNLMNYV